MFDRIKSQIKAIFNAKLPFEILESIEPLDQEEVQTKQGFFEQANDNIIKIDLREKQSSIIALIIIIVLAIFLILIGSKSKEGLTHPVSIIVLTIITLLFLYFSVKLFINKKVFIILDREHGIFSFPYRINRYKSYTLKFDEAIVFWTGSGGVTGNLDMHLVAQHPDKKIGGANLISHHIRDYRKTWSFYVWYMDRNRPLPPGTAFDPYREKDFQRRKAEGFPKPLYRSHIPTPEATPEQQAEREKYWKDEIEEFTREPNSVMYDANIHKGWLKSEFKSLKEEKPMVNYYYRYEFEDGSIVYMKTDENGYGYTPPDDMNYTVKGIEVIESWF